MPPSRGAYDHIRDYHDYWDRVNEARKKESDFYDSLCSQYGIREKSDKRNHVGLSNTGNYHFDKLRNEPCNGGPTLTETLLEVVIEIIVECIGHARCLSFSSIDVRSLSQLRNELISKYAGTPLGEKLRSTPFAHDSNGNCSRGTQFRDTSYSSDRNESTSDYGYGDRGHAGYSGESYSGGSVSVSFDGGRTYY
jgi:hypothetical protein